MKEASDLRDSFDDFKASGKEYLDLKWDAFKLRMVDNLSVIFGRVLGIFLLILLVVTALIFLASGLNHFLGDIWGSIAANCFTAGVFIFLAIIVFLFRKKIFVDALVRTFAKIFFEKDSMEKGGEL